MRNYRLETRASIGAVTGPVGLLLGLVAVVIALSSTASATAHHAQHKITAKQLAPGAVTAKAIRKGAVGKNALAEGAVTNAALADKAVNARALAEGAVTPPAIAPAAVTHGAVAPGSISAANLAAESIHVTPIADKDAVASNPEWTPSNTETALCGPGEDLLGTGFMFTEPGDHEVSFLRSQPFLAGTGNGVAGEISSNSGGTAKAQIMAICLAGG
jgi:hypothetical protein